MGNNSGEMKTYTFFAVGQLIMGIMGIGLGLWVEFYRPATPGELMINKSLILFSIGFVISALMMLSLIKKQKTN